MMIAVWTGCKPTKQTWEIIRIRHCRLEIEAKLMAHVDELKSKTLESWGRLVVLPTELHAAPSPPALPPCLTSTVFNPIPEQPLPPQSVAFRFRKLLGPSRFANVAFETNGGSMSSQQFGRKFQEKNYGWPGAVPGAVWVRRNLTAMASGLRGSVANACGSDFIQ